MVFSKQILRGVMNMQSVIQAYLAETKIGRSQTYRNLAIFPILSSHSATIDYMTLDEALAEHMIDIKEVSEAGSVPELKVVNKSPRMVLILDGEELVGAKQNRAVNTTILIQGQTTTVIPVSCVEQGRWAYESPRFYSQKRVMSPQLRARKAEQVHRSIRASEGFRSDQGAIWDEISSKAARLKAQSPTMSMSAIYEKKRSSLVDYVKHFRPFEMQVGAAFLINGEVVGVDTFGRQETFRKVFKKLVESYALDAVDWFEPGDIEKALRREVTEFLRDM
jgi:hypothetical protein